MTSPDLSAMLSDPGEVGVFFVSEEARDAAIAAAEELDYVYAPIALDDCRDRDAVLQRIAQALRFPDWFGGNWDALSDCLDDLSWLPADGYLLVFEGATPWRDSDPAGFRTLLEILSDTGDRWRELAVPFWSLLPPGHASDQTDRDDTDTDTDTDTDDART